MPIYEYLCRSCGKITERFFKVEDKEGSIFCQYCSGTADSIVSTTAVHGEYPPWIDDNLRASIQEDDEKPIESRTELNKAVEEKGLVENPKR